VMSRLHRGRRQLRELLTAYATERGFLRPKRDAANAPPGDGAAVAAEPVALSVGGAGTPDDANVGDERKGGRGDGLR